MTTQSTHAAVFCPVQSAHEITTDPAVEDDATETKDEGCRPIALRRSDRDA